MATLRNTRCWPDWLGAFSDEWRGAHQYAAGGDCLNYFHDWLRGFSGPLRGGVTNRARRPGSVVWWRIKILPNDKGI
ncbi:hypothetical protein MAHJHV53_44770 [Mycobacterium avium subsp. hominissuis]